MRPIKSRVKIYTIDVFLLFLNSRSAWFRSAASLISLCLSLALAISSGVQSSLLFIDSLAQQSGQRFSAQRLCELPRGHKQRAPPYF